MAIVKYKNTGEEVEVEVGTRLKDVIDKNSWPVPFGCEDGLCGTCIVMISSGFENMNDFTEREKITLEAMGLDDGNHRLSCQSIINGDIEFETH